MKMKRILIFLIIGLFAFTLTGCPSNDDDDKNPGGKDDPKIDDTKIVTDSEMVTPYTDGLKLDASYEGKDFITDGIGEVTVESYVDGDTTIFKTKNNVSFTARYNGIDTPESTYTVEPWGYSAAKFTRNKLASADKIVAQADTVKKSRFDSTGKRYLTWVWYLPKGETEFRLLNLEVVEQAYSTGKASGTMYTDTFYNADLATQEVNVRIWNKVVQDPSYDYSTYGTYYSLKNISETFVATNDTEGYQKGKKVRVQGIVSRKFGTSSAYIQQQEDGYWYIDGVNTEVVASSNEGNLPYVGANGNWFIGETDTNKVAQNGIEGQDAYEYYLATETQETKLNQIEWLRSITTEDENFNLDSPYIVKDETWYGVYLYGGYADVTSLRVGREVIIEGNIGYYNGSVQIINVNNSTVSIYSATLVEPFVAELSVDDFLASGTKYLGCLVKLENLKVKNGYDTVANDGYTIYAESENGKEIVIRVDDKVAIILNTEKTELQEDGYTKNTTWEFFKNKTFTSVTAVVGRFNGNLQLMISGNSDIELAE